MSELPKGFRPVSDNHRPPKGDTKYEVQFRRLNDTPFIDSTGYTAGQLVWVHTGESWDVVAVREIK